MFKQIKKKYSAYVLLLAVVGMPASYAREMEAKGFTLRLLAWSEEQPLPLFVQTDVDTFEALDLRTNRRSPRYDLNKSRVVRIFTEGLDTEGNPIMVPVLQIPIADTIREPLVILFSSMEAGKPVYRGIAGEDSVEAFPFGSYRVINLTGYPVKVELDGRGYDVPGLKSVMARPTVNERTNIAVRFQVLLDGNLHLVRQTFWRHQTDQRMLVFVLRSQDPQRREFVLHTVSEREAVYRRLHENENIEEGNPK